jgi:aryl-alcohol dehydrogenase-like predicted oxidoreductase
METRNLGATGLVVSRLGLGLAALGRPGYINLGHANDLGHDYAVTAMQRQTDRVLDAAWAGGICYFDAARSYGRAEEFLGRWLRERRLSSTDLTVGSKWGYTYTAGWSVEAEQHEVKDHTLRTFEYQWQESQTQLGNYLHLYQVHSATLESGILENREVLTALARLKEAGIAVGLSLSGPRQAETLARALVCLVDGVRVFDCVQATWNLLERAAGAQLQAAHNAGMGVIIKEALANGRLTARNREPGFAGQLALLKQQAHRLGTTVDALALAGVLAQSWADVVLSGAATVAQVESNLGAVTVHWDGEADVALAGLIEAPAVYWETRSRLAWN